MGAAIHLLMDKGEKARLLSRISGAIGFNKDVGCCVKDGKSNKVIIEYQSGEFHREWALALAYCICKKYTGVRGGWDSNGVLEPVAVFGKFRAFEITIGRARRYYRQYKDQHPDAAEIQKSDFDNFTRLQKEYETEANRRLDEIPKFNFIIAQKLQDGRLSSYGFPPGGFQVQYGSHEDAEALVKYAKGQLKGRWKVFQIPILDKRTNVGIFNLPK